MDTVNPTLLLRKTVYLPCQTRFLPQTLARPLLISPECLATSIFRVPSFLCIAFAVGLVSWCFPGTTFCPPIQSWLSRQYRISFSALFAFSPLPRSPEEILGRGHNFPLPSFMHVVRLMFINANGSFSWPFLMGAP